MKGFSKIEKASEKKEASNYRLERSAPLETRLSEYAESSSLLRERSILEERGLPEEDDASDSISSLSDDFGAIELGKRSRSTSSAEEEEPKKRARRESLSLEENKASSSEEAIQTTDRRYLSSGVMSGASFLEKPASEVLQEFSFEDLSATKTREEIFKESIENAIKTECLMPSLFQAKNILDALGEIKRAQDSSPSFKNLNSKFLVIKYSEELEGKAHAILRLFSDKDYLKMFQKIHRLEEVLTSVEKERSLLEKQYQVFQHVQELQSVEEGLPHWTSTMKILWEAASRRGERVVEAKVKKYHHSESGGNKDQILRDEVEFTYWIALAEDGKRYEQALISLNPLLQEKGKELLEYPRCVLQFQIAKMKEMPEITSFQEAEQAYRDQDEEMKFSRKTIDKNLLEESKELRVLDHYSKAMNWDLKKIYALRKKRSCSLFYYNDMAHLHRELAKIISDDHDEINSIKPLLIKICQRILEIEEEKKETLDRSDDIALFIDNNTEADGSFNKTALLYQTVQKNMRDALRLRNDAINALLNGKEQLSQDLRKIATIAEDFAIDEEERVTALSEQPSGITPENFINETAEERKELAEIEEYAKKTALKEPINKEIAFLCWSFNKTLEENLVELEKKK